MASRKIAWRNKPPQFVQETLADASQLKLYLLQEIGPTSFVFNDEDKNKYKVSIGTEIKCSCDSNKKDHCVHTLYVLLKIFKLDQSNPLLWQGCYLDQDVAELIRYRYNPEGERKPKKIEKFLKRSHIPKSKPNSTTLRQDVDEGDVCPICHEDMTKDEGTTFCKKSCGNNFHFKCILIWAEHRNQIGDNISCPMCRSDWGKRAYEDLLKEFEEFQSKNIIHKGHRCRTCKVNKHKNVKGRLFHCMHCENYEICEPCFLGFEHYEHNRYLMKEIITDDWRPAPNRDKVIWNQKDFDEIDIENCLKHIPALKTLSETELALKKFLLSCFSDVSSMPNISEGNITQNLLSIVGIDVKRVCSYCHSDGTTISKLKKLGCSHLLHGHCLLEMIANNLYQCPEDGSELLKGYKSTLQPHLPLQEQKLEKSEKEKDKKIKPKTFEESKLPRKIEKLPKKLDPISLDIKGKGIANENVDLDPLEIAPDKLYLNPNSQYQSPGNPFNSKNKRPPLPTKNTNKIKPTSTVLPPILGLQGNNILLEKGNKETQEKKPLSSQTNSANINKEERANNLKNFRINASNSTHRQHKSRKSISSLSQIEPSEVKKVISKTPVEKKSRGSKIEVPIETSNMNAQEDPNFEQLGGWD